MLKKDSSNFRAFSAASYPSGRVHPEAIHQFESAGLSAEGLHRKSWNEFGQPSAPRMDFVFTVCDGAAAVQDSPEQVRRAFFEAYTVPDRRITLSFRLLPASLEGPVIQHAIDRIGKS